VQSIYRSVRVAQRGHRWLVVALALSICRTAECSGQELARTVRVTAENDYFDFWLPPNQRSDDNYTQGAHVSWDVARVPSFARRVVCREKAACASTIEIRQDIYTPMEDAPGPIPGQRPYAGWLGVRASAVEGTPRSRRTISATIGVTGPASLAAQTQEAFHHLIPAFRHPRGWDYQLPTEAAVALSAEAAWHLRAPGWAAQWADLEPATHATLGTLRTALGIGGRARVGTGLSHPWLVDSTARPWEAYVFLGGQAEGVARDLFLDGSTFQQSVRVDRTAVVSAWERGIGIRLGRVGLEYRAVTQSREYKTGPVSHSFGGIGVTWWNAR
jgi:hypothetical protein